MQSVSRNKLLHNISVWGPEFEIIFDLRIHSWVRGWASILRFQAVEGDDGSVGQRAPALFTRSSQRNKIHVATNIGDDGNNVTAIGVPGLNRWVKIKISQKRREVSYDSDIECTCLPVSVLEKDMEQLKNPLGSKEEQCYQVDSKIAFTKKDMNGKYFFIHRYLQNFKNIFLTFLFHLATMMDSMMTDWKVEDTINHVLAG